MFITADIRATSPTLKHRLFAILEGCGEEEEGMLLWYKLEFCLAKSEFESPETPKSESPKAANYSKSPKIQCTKPGNDCVYS